MQLKMLFRFYFTMTCPFWRQLQPYSWFKYLAQRTCNSSTGKTINFNYIETISRILLSFLLLLCKKDCHMNYKILVNDQQHLRTPLLVSFQSHLFQIPYFSTEHGCFHETQSGDSCFHSTLQKLASPHFSKGKADLW